MEGLKVTFIFFFCLNSYGASNAGIDYAEKELEYFENIPHDTHKIMLKKIANFYDFIISDAKAQKYKDGILNFTIPEILFCNYGLNEKKFYYYPSIRDFGLLDKLKKQVGIGIPQKIGFSRRKIGDLEKNLASSDFGAKLFFLIAEIFKLSEKNYEKWDQFTVGLSCISAAIIFPEKEYSAEVKDVLKNASQGIFKQIYNSRFSCLSLTNFVMAMADYLVEPAYMNFLKNSGNPHHAFIRTYSDIIPNSKIYIDPYLFLTEFRTLRKNFKDKRTNISYPDSLMNLTPPGIAYEANRRNFRQVWFKGKKENKNECSVGFSIDYKEGNSFAKFNTNFKQPNSQTNDCEGEMFALTWRNHKEKKDRAKIFALLADRNKLYPIAIPTHKSLDPVLSIFLGSLDVKIKVWFARYFNDVYKISSGNFSVIKINSFDEFKRAHTRDFSEYYLRTP